MPPSLKQHQPGKDLAAAPAEPRTMWSLWLGVALVFLLMACAWFFLFRAANTARVQSVPLATQGGKP
jgi:hypothetical protein